MIIKGHKSLFHEVTLAFLTPIDTDDLPRYFSTSEQLTAYLKNRPQMRFSLKSSRLGVTLSDDNADNDNQFYAYGPKFGDVLFGNDGTEVFYDSNENLVFTKGPTRIRC
jgi:hypothetical protein